jgi:hypothetical protein
VSEQQSTPQSHGFSPQRSVNPIRTTGVFMPSPIGQKAELLFGAPKYSKMEERQ